MFFDGWDEIGRVLLLGALSYAGLVFLLRISGKRTLSKLNSFDFVITIAFGSPLAGIILNRDVSLSEGITAPGLLIFMQFVVTYLSVRSSFFEKIIKGRPV